MFSLSLAALAATAQNKEVKDGEVPKGWHLLDKAKDGYSGISIKEAYEFVKSKNLESNTVIVAVIDGGVDTVHEDLKPILWRNPKEIPGNGKDDDENGYVDDIYGWNFLGNKDGKNVGKDSYEGARVYHALKWKYADKTIDTTKMAKDSVDEYRTWLKVKAKVEGEGDGSGIDLFLLKKALNSTRKSDSILRKALNKDTFTGNDLDTLNASDPVVKAARGGMLYMFRAQQMMETSNVEFVQGFSDFVSGEESKAEAKEKAPPANRKDIVGDNENDFNDRFYGNGDVTATTPFHGTHVSGIIGAVRNNNLGIDGVADNVRIMMIRAVPDGDEHDKDIALGIRYAVDNGAKVINMSFGKEFSPQKKWIDSAVMYADSKGVLLVHAAGNDAKNVDSADNFPNPHFKDTDIKAPNWITVGASGDEKAGGVVASFSNYGKQEVDVFAPGVRIYSTIPGGHNYGNAQGTSMAAPVVTGTAAFLMSYFPKLSPEQIKYCIEKSAVKQPGKVRKPGTDEEVDFATLSKTGGLLNAFEAAKVADTLKPEKKKKRRHRRAPKTEFQNIQG